MNSTSTSSQTLPANRPNGLRRSVQAPPDVRPAAAVRLLIADDHQIFRMGLRKLLESEPGFDVVGEAGDGASALALVRQLNPDFLLLDLAMPNMSGLDTLRELATLGFNCQIVLLAAAIEKAQMLEALRLGARGVVLKESATALLFKCVRAVMAGEFWVGRESVADLVLYLRQIPATPRVAPRATFRLTPRELQIISAVVTGSSNKQIAEQLSISTDTVKHHLTSIFDKIGMSNRLELALFAVHNGLVSA
jgi:two-component system nitrate/nitrite response regulator NarL